jgi:hypothetical protein
MEAEANRFAAELLMPSAWIAETADRSDHIAGMLTTVHRVCDVSLEAALYRTVQNGLPGYIIGQVREGIVQRFFKTKFTMTLAPEPGILLSSIDMPTAEEPIVVPHGDTRYYCWRVDRTVRAGAIPAGDWRSTLRDILSIVPEHRRHATQQSVNAIVGLAIGNSREELRLMKCTRVY